MALTGRASLRKRRALKSVQLAKRVFGLFRGCTVINFSQFLPLFNGYKISEKIDVPFFYYIKLL
jgi:hypothetical protein